MLDPNQLKLKQTLKDFPEASVPSFIRKTYEILEEGKHADVVKWSDDGKCIVISNPTEFAQKVLPTYFKHNNLTSFIRQLNMYDFHKKRTHNMDHIYCHELFQRGKKYLLKDIRRKNSEVIPMGGEKTMSSIESTQARQDLATVVHENVVLKNINKETLAKVNLIESKLKDKELENQTLWNQIHQLKEKELLLKNVILSFIKQQGLSIASLPPILQNEFELAVLNLKNHKDSSPQFIPQTTTKVHFPVGEFSLSQAFPIQQQEGSREIYISPIQILPQSEKYFTLGPNNQPIYLEAVNNNDNRYSVYNYDLNLAPNYVDAWSLGLPIKQEGDATTQSPMTENTMGNLNMNENQKISMDLLRGYKELGNKKIRPNTLYLTENGSKIEFQPENNTMSGLSANLIHSNSILNRNKFLRVEAVNKGMSEELPHSYR